MMARLDVFVSDVVKSRLLTREQVEAVRDEAPPGPESEAPLRLARVLVGRGWLTPYQARKLLAGITRGFFLGGYRILRRLGQGGMGKVYLAVHEKTGERVALKVLPPKKALEEEQALARFRREMDLSRRVSHPNIARTVEVGDQDGVYYMAMEYVPGESLYNLIKGEDGAPWRVPDTARYFLGVVDALAAAHKAGLVHRDIKPSNLMVTPEGDAKLLDLGLARASGEESPLTRPNVVIGTLDYASPEQLSDAARADQRSDLYSLGCTLYFTLAGRPPFEGGDVVNKIYKQRMEDPEPLESATRGVPSAFAAVVRKLMAKEPADRYQTARDLRRDLQRWTDPAIVKAILGTEAEAARAFRPPPPELDDEDLRFLDGSAAVKGDRGSSLELRQLGPDEPGVAPMHKPPAPPKPAVVLDAEEYGEDEGFAPVPSVVDKDMRWLVWVAAGVISFVAVVLVLVAVLR